MLKTLLSLLLCAQLALGQAVTPNIGLDLNNPGSPTNLTKIDSYLGGITPIPGGGVNGATITPKIISGISKCDKYAGADVSIKVNACIADAISQANGNGTAIADASNLGGDLLTSEPIILGNSPGASVLLILPCYGSWQANFTNTSSTNGFALLQYGGAATIGLCPVSDKFYIGNTPGSNLYAIWGVYGASGSSYTHASGFSVINSSGNPTVSGYSVIVNGMNPSETFCDGSRFQNVSVSDGANGGASGVGAVQIQNVGCGFTWANSFLSGSGVGTPVTIQGSNTSIIQGLNFFGDTFVGPGAGKPVFSCQDTATTPDTIVNVYGGYSESDTSNTNSTEVSIDGCRKVKFDGHTFSSNVANNTSKLFNVTSRYNTELEVIGTVASIGTGTWAYPIIAVQNANDSGGPYYTDPAGNFGEYFSPTTLSVFGGARAQYFLANGFNYTGAGRFPLASLPSASAYGNGATVIVIDATTYTVGPCTSLTGGGIHYMIAISDGTAWSCH